MYTYIDIIVISFLLMSVYVVSFNSNKKKKKVKLVSALLMTILFKCICILHVMDIKMAVHAQSLFQLTVFLVAIQMTKQNNKFNQAKYIILFNYAVIISLLINSYTVDIYLYTSVAITYLFISSLYLLFLEINNKKSKKIYLGLQMIYICQILITAMFDLRIGILPSVLDLLMVIYIFNIIFNKELYKLNSKSLEMNSELKRTKINIKMYSEKLNTNKKIRKIIEKNLIKKQDLLELIQNQSEGCILLIDENGYILNDDNNFSRMWAEYKDSKYNIHISIFLKKSIKDKEKFLIAMEDSNKNNKEVNVEIKGKDNRYFESTYTPFIINDKKIGTLCVLRDITYKKNSEMKIKDIDTKYKKIVDNIPYSILITDKNDILYNNHKLNYINFEKEDLKNIVTSASNIGEMYYTCKENKDICMDIGRVSFEEESNKKNLVVIKDITEYKRMQKRSEYNKRRYEMLVDTIPEGIYVLDYDEANFTYINDKVPKILGEGYLNTLNNINKDIAITSGEENDNVIFKRYESINNDKNINIESGAILIDVNNRVKMVGIIRDITEQVKAELIELEIKAKMKENKDKTEFFINMSHELKTPLNVIHSTNQLIEALYREEIKNNSDGDMARITETIRRYSNLLMTLTSNIIDLAKLQTDFHYAKKDYYNIVEIVESVVSDFSAYIENKNVDIIFDTEVEETICNVDPEDIQKIIIMIISMIIRYSLENSNISVNIYSIDKEVIINIENNGGYDYNKYLLDEERNSLDIGVNVSKLIMGIYNGTIDVNVTSTKSIKVSITIQSESSTELEVRTINSESSDLYEEYSRIYKF